MALIRGGRQATEGHRGHVAIGQDLLGRTHCPLHLWETKAVCFLPVIIKVPITHLGSH